MIAPFTLTLPPKVRFGRGEALAAIPDIAALGERIALVHGASATRAEPVIRALEDAGLQVTPIACPGEPTLEMLTKALRAAQGAQAVVAVGGGAALDLGKALAALLPVPGVDPMDHLEVVGRGLPLPAPPAPFVAIPTTAGTGSEATKNAVISVPEHRRKVSLRDDRMLPVLAVIDPSLTDGTPRPQTLASGLDAVTQVIEPFLSRRANPVTDALCREAIPRGLTALARLMEAEDTAARDALALTSHLSGIALANAGLGAVHGLAGVIGGETGEPHGAICGRLLPHVLAANAEAADEDTRTRIAAIDEMLDQAFGIRIDGLAGWIAHHGLTPGRPPLTAQTRADIADRSAASSSMKPNPVTLSPERLSQILEAAGW